MINNLKVLALIPARGGSKGLPGKNKKDFVGKPLIVHSIEAGLKSRYIDSLVVSTDDLEIKDISVYAGAKCPFIRPDYLSADEAKSIDVVHHALNYLKEDGENFDLVVLLEPTSPLRTSQDIDEAIELLVQSEAESLVGIARTESQHPSFQVTRNAAGFLDKITGHSFEALRRQDITETYYLEGSIYISFVESLFKRNSFYHERTMGMIFPKYKAIEIDDMDDFIMAEALFNFYNKEK